MPYLLVAFFLLFSLFGCGTDTSDGGSATTTTNGIVLTSTMTPAGSVKYSIVDVELWESSVTNGIDPVLETGTTDSTGIISLGDYKDQIVGIHVFDSVTGEALWNEVIVNEGDCDTFYLAPVSRYSGIISGAKVDTVRLAPTDIVMAVDSNGAYSYNSTPAGLYPVTVVRNMSVELVGSVELLERDSADDRAIPVDDTLILMDDFERKGLTYTARGLNTNGRWYYFSDADLGYDTYYEHKVVDEGKGNNKWVHSQVTFDDSLEQAYAGLGFTLGQKSFSFPKGDGLYYDLSNATSISCDLKGPAVIQLKVTTAVQNSKGANAEHFSKIITVGDTKEKVVIPVDSLSVKDGTLWSEVSDSVSRISFSVLKRYSTDGKAEFWIDNIYLHGDVDF